MSSSRLKDTSDRQRPPAEPPATDLLVNRQSDAFRFVQAAHATGKPLDLTNMTDREVAEYVTGQA